MILSLRYSSSRFRVDPFFLGGVEGPKIPVIVDVQLGRVAFQFPARMKNSKSALTASRVPPLG